MSNYIWSDQNNVDFLRDMVNNFEEFRNIKLKLKDKKKINPCEIDTLKKKLLSYQRILRFYFTKGNKYRGLLIYHGLGSGKTATSISIAEKLDRQVVLLIPASLKGEWYSEIMKWGSKDYKKPKDFDTLSLKEQKKIEKQLREKIDKKYIMISHNSGITGEKIRQLDRYVKDETNIPESDADSTFVMSQMKKIGGLDNKLLIIDEVHNVLTNITNLRSKNGEEIRKSIMNAKNLRLLFLSGTPCIRDPFELGVLFNMLRGKMKIQGDRQVYYSFPEEYGLFREYFVKRKESDFHIRNKHVFQDRINGLVSYFSGIKEDNLREIFPSKNIKTILVRMSSYQWKKYIQARSVELEEERKSKYRKVDVEKVKNKKPGRQSFTTYRMSTRQISNFVFPPKIKRPVLNRNEDPKVHQQNIAKVLINLNKTHLKDELEKYSPKMSAIINNIEETKKGKIFVYSDFLTLEGIGIFTRVLDVFGYKKYNDSNTKPYKSYAVWSGKTSDNERNLIKKKFNDKKNKYGKDIRIFLSTAAGTEGISLTCIKKLIIMEPYWHRTRIDQVIGRAIRICSHKDLPIEERHVDVFLYLSIQPKGIDVRKILKEEENNETTDLSLFSKANRQQKLIREFLDSMKEMAIDCHFNYQHNKNEVKQCRICDKTNDLIYEPDIENSFYMNNCITNEEREVIVVEYKNKEYGIDNDSEVFDITDPENPQIVDDKNLKKKILKKIKT